MTEAQKKRWSILACNSLFGYQFENGTEKDHFAICYCDGDMSPDIVATIRKESGAQSLTHGDFIGHGFLKIHLTDLDRVPAIFNSMLTHNQWFRTNNRAQVGFNAERNGDREFTKEIMEQNFIKQIRANILDNPDMRRWCATAHHKIWNYESDEGRQLCLELRELVGKKNPPNLESKGNYWKWASFTEEPIEQKAKKQEDEDDDECMICLERAPNTTVEPCGCRVVCSQCSDGLKNTADAHTCVRCRRPIEKINL